MLKDQEYSPVHLVICEARKNAPAVEHFVDKLKPHARLIENPCAGRFPTNYPDNPLPEPDSDLTKMIMDLEEAAYIVGIFMAAKLAGASSDTLQRLRENLVL